MAIAIPAGFNALSVPLAQLSLAAVLGCRWSILPLNLPSPNTSPTHEYRLCLRDRVVCLRQASDTLFYRAVFPMPVPLEEEKRQRDAETLAWIHDYFQLDVDLVQLYDKWSERDPIFKTLRHQFTGIRILREDPWECLIFTICSTNNTSSRMAMMVHSLCASYSQTLLHMPLPSSEVTSLPSPVPPSESESSDRKADKPMQAYYPFPPPSALAHLEVVANLRALKVGYRSDFIQKTAQMLVEEHGPSDHEAEDWLMRLREMGMAEARTELLKFMGIGRKVADCILLMSLDKPEVIPVDTHIYQVAVKQYGFPGTAKGSITPKLYEEISLKLSSVWMDYAGWAHYVLFAAKVSASPGISLLLPSLVWKPSNELADLSPSSTLPSPAKRKRSVKTLPPPSSLVEQLWSY